MTPSTFIKVLTLTWILGVSATMALAGVVALRDIGDAIRDNTAAERERTAALNRIADECGGHPKEK